MFSKNVRVQLDRVVLNDPSVFKKRATMEDGPEKYRANFTLDPENPKHAKQIKKIEKAIEQVKEELGIAKLKEGRSCFYDGNDTANDEGVVRQGYADVMVLRATSNKRPKVVDRDGETPLTEDDDAIYGGVIVNGYVDIYATNDKKIGGNGVFATLMGIQRVKDGTRFGGGSGLGDDAFSAVEDDEDDEDDRPAKKTSKSKDDDEDDRPAKKKKPARDEDDEDDRPAKKKKRYGDDDDEDERPAKKKKSTRRDDDEDEDI